MNRNISQQRHYDMLVTALGSTIMGLLNDDDVIEIMVNPDGRLHVEALSTGKRSTDTYYPAQQVANMIKLVASGQNRIADTEHPEVALELPINGARFQGWLPPVVDRPTFSLRKRAVQIFTLQDYLDTGAITAEQKSLLENAIKQRKNIIIAGGTSSGKTTLTNALLDQLRGCPDRILVLEDLPELQLACDDVVVMRTTPQISMRDLVKGSLRMRPDRIIVGEVRDGAALELLKAWNTGHPGSLCTLHANSAEDTVLRLEDLIREAIPVVPQQLIVRAVDYIVFIARDLDGKRRVESIVEVVGIENGKYQFAEPDAG